MDKSIFRNISYGMYIVTSKKQNEKFGCVINTLTQITSENPIIMISLNKNNCTNKVIKETKKFAVSILSKNTSKETIAIFGYHSSKDTNKFANTTYKIIDNVPVILDNVCGYIICEVQKIVDCNTHDIIIARVTTTKKLENNNPMTYKYYHEILKGTSPKNAPTYIEEKTVSNEEISKYQCIICGHIYDDAKEKVKFEDLPNDWKCPLCGATKEQFKKIN
jgi:flavin reductase (DIM6/NTAB) family NADH-FMN oxidoreductase RutF/rubredoxin